MDGPTPIRDYALIADGASGALVSREGSIDWLCLPRYDSPSMFAALLGGPEAGHWTLRPTSRTATPTREYVPGTFVLRTVWRDGDAEAEVIDFMPFRDGRSNLVRVVRGLSGAMEFRDIIRLRFDYGALRPWVRRIDEPGGPALLAVAGPDAVVIRGVRHHAEDGAHVAEFAVGPGEVAHVGLTRYASHHEPPSPIDLPGILEWTIDWWQDWASRSEPPSPYDREVQRSLLVLRGLTHDETGGVVAAATTSLPEELGGSRNWDYRYVWLRDAALTIEVLVDHGYREEAEKWRRWLLRAIAGDPSGIQIMYDVEGARRLPEIELGHLPGYAGSAPVRTGNAAYTQVQWDVYGEVMVALHAARRAGLRETEFSWPLQIALLDFLGSAWERPDRGIWEIRGPDRHFTHSKAMVWAAFDRGIRGVEEFGLAGPVEEWRRHRDLVRDDILHHGFDAARNTFTQYYGGAGTDAALLVLPQIGFIEADDPRMLGTVAAIERELLRDGLLLRYRTETDVDGLPGNENPFLACSFWLVEQYAASGRLEDARALMRRLNGFVNDVGLLSEEVDPASGAHMGNTPQALSHLSLVRAADAIAKVAHGQAEELPDVRGE
ncbi:glycoside hydrolase family 15 protein [Agromyces aurantiacus]|uniref:Glycoside hydrolase family 15 protein n=1 Tax=Agromyces aurantiacus TaxID=165814 RepID=A0ABV9R5G0_9MICO|nr:glycoside hydrolase family 15 protein [Agromyces aurantiacus]MBM7503196.1 GH15 family glucan-1,4-alpha-glucosidase [Agromyces aurantiacus]